VLTGAEAAVERQRDVGKERRQRRAWCESGGGRELAFYSGQGSVGEAASGGIKALTPLMVAGSYEGRGGLNQGNQGGGVNTLMGHLEARS
jgi:hypothetical protein